MSKTITITADKYENTRVSIKNIKHNASASEETNYFSANVYLDDICVVEAHNSGQGGQTWFRLNDASNKEKLDEAEVYAKTLPAIVYDNVTLPMTLDFLVDSIVGDVINAKTKREFETKIKRLCKSKTVLKEGEDYFTLNFAYDPKYKSQIIAKYPNSTIVNEM